MSETGVLIVFCTFPDADTARQIGTALVERQLAKCVNLIPSVESIYTWKGEIERSQETLGMIKTSAESYGALEAALVQLHPYEVPEIIAANVSNGLEAYLRWITEGES